MPRATYMPYPFQILQSASQMFIAYEYAGAVRNIYMQDPGPAPTDSWMGQSVGRWEGYTLVVEATALGGQAAASRRIENYLGFPAGITGTELTSRAVTQARKFNARTATPYRAMSLEPGTARTAWSTRLVTSKRASAG